MKLKSKHFSRHIRNAADTVFRINMYLSVWLRCVGRSAGRPFRHSHIALLVLLLPWRVHVFHSHTISYNIFIAMCRLLYASRVQNIADSASKYMRIGVQRHFRTFCHSNHTLFRSFAFYFIFDLYFFSRARRHHRRRRLSRESAHSFLFFASTLNKKYVLWMLQFLPFGNSCSGRALWTNCVRRSSSKWQGWRVKLYSRVEVIWNVLERKRCTHRKMPDKCT